MTDYIEVFSDSAYNTGIAATASETLSSSAENRRKYAPFNRLSVTNRDALDIKVYLDGLNQTGRILEIPQGVAMTIEPEEGLFFSFVKQENLHAANAETANKILFRWARCEPKK